jgi:S1-C subfamily serine protease
MKRILLILLIAFLICVPVLAGTMIYNLNPVPYTVSVDGQALKSGLPIMTYPSSQGDNTYVPLRAVLELTGANVQYKIGRVDIVTPQADPEKVANSVVEIYVSKNGKDVEQGSGVIIGYDQIVTCSHVADKGDSYRIIYNDGTTTTAKLVKDNPATDIAVLDPVKEDVKPVKIGDSDEIKVGDKVFVVSSPKEKKNVVTEGKVLYLQTLKGNTHIMTNAKSEVGSSGGGLFNSNGELIGIVAQGTSEIDFSGSVLINDVRKVF